jgi:ribonuclease inhibitor
MKKIVLDARKMNTREKAHEYLAKECEFPDYYGKNLDAAYDCLSTCGETIITVEHAGTLEKNLGDYGKAFLQVLKDAGENNSKLIIEIK